MRIGIDCRTYWSHWGYIGKYIESFVSYLQQNEDSHEYVLFFNDRELSGFTRVSKNIRTIKTSAKRGNLSEQIIFPYELKKEKLDIMLFSEPRIPFFYFKKSIIILPDLLQYFYPEKHLKWTWMRNWHNYILRQSIRKSDTIIALSEVLKHDIIEIFDTPEEKIHIISPMYYDILLISENESKQFLQKENLNKEYILSVWELREYKNIPRFLQAYNMLLKEHEIDMDLVLVGKEDPTYHEIRSTLIDLWLQNRVHIYNIHEDDKLGILYQNASLYVLPSLYEGSEQTLLSSFAYCLPTVSSILPSITPFLGKNNVASFRPMSIPDMREALRKALKNPLIKRDKKYMTAYSPSSVSRQMLDIFNLYKGTEEKSEKEEK